MKTFLQCDAPVTNIDKVATDVTIANFSGGVPLREQFVESAYKAITFESCAPYL